MATTRKKTTSSIDSKFRSVHYVGRDNFDRNTQSSIISNIKEGKNTQSDGVLSLLHVVEAFNAPVNEEQAWAICFQCAEHYSQVSRQLDSASVRNFIYFTQRQELEDVYVRTDGSITVGKLDTSSTELESTGEQSDFSLALDWLYLPVGKKIILSLTLTHFSCHPWSYGHIAYPWMLPGNGGMVVILKCTAVFLNLF